jgi:nucleoside-triphosphatase THEP1
MIIALTGGPCGGKTTAIEFLKKELEGKGVAVRVVPEIASLLADMGFHPATECRRSPDSRYNYHRMMFDTQIALEDFARRTSNIEKKPTVIVCDRGAMDLKSYSDQFSRILTSAQTTELEVLQRYDRVYHLTSTAVDKPGIYQRTSNVHRHESVETSAWRDQDLRRAWAGHRCGKTLDNRGSMEDKCAILLADITAAMGIKTPSLPAVRHSPEL